MIRNPCRGWRDGDTASKISRDGKVLAIGTVRVRKAESSGRPYLKVAVIGRQQWEWPEGWVIGKGETAGVCLECDQAYRTDEKHPSGFCPPCDRNHLTPREQSPTREIRNLTAYSSVRYSTRPDSRPLTADEVLEFERQKAEDAERSPFG